MILKNIPAEQPISINNAQHYLHYVPKPDGASREIKQERPVIRSNYQSHYLLPSVFFSYTVHIPVWQKICLKQNNGTFTTEMLWHENKDIFLHENLNSPFVYFSSYLN